MAVTPTSPLYNWALTLETALQERGINLRIEPSPITVERGHVHMNWNIVLDLPDAMGPKEAYYKRQEVAPCSKPCSSIRALAGTPNIA